ncbi:TPA: hypothetical protein NKV59_000711 [Vibrio parahaemolyticus]|nr:hypothetical protein [Vibrio parahaemolyticus]
MTKEVHKILILDGVEDYLTDLAKKYKRNLMLVGFILVSIYVISGQGIDIELTSAFGFSFKGSGEKVGIGLELLAGMLSVICLYEMGMLFIYKQQCDSHYFGKQISKSNKDGDNEGLDYLKREFNIISRERHVSEDIQELISKYLNTNEKRDSSIARLESPSEFEKSCSEVLDKVITEHQEKNMVLVCNVVTEIGHHLQQRHVRCLSDLNENQKRYFEEAIVDAIKRNQLAPKTSYEHIKSTFFDRYENLFSNEAQLIQSNEEWKTYIEHQLQESINVHEKLLKKLDSFSAPKKLIVIMEVYLPLLWGAFSIFLGLSVAM